VPHAVSNVLIIADDPELGASVAAGLASHGFHPRVARTCQRAQALLVIAAYKAVLIQRSHLSRCASCWTGGLRMRDVDRCIPILIFALGEQLGHTDVSGGSDFGARLRESLRRFHDSVPGSARLVARGIILDRVADTVECRGKPLHLSPIEFRLLAYFMSNPDLVLSAEQLLANVWGRNSDPGRTVAMNVAHLRKAIADRKANSIIRTVRGRGYVFRSARSAGLNAVPGHLSPGVARPPVRVHPRPRRRRAAGLRGLRPRERSLLELLLLNPEITFSRECIAGFVWGPGAIDLRTVDATVSRVRQVLQRSLDDPIRGVIGRGYQINIRGWPGNVDLELGCPA
jgi:DNA-binding response OmpR family regulator